MQRLSRYLFQKLKQSNLAFLIAGVVVFVLVIGLNMLVRGVDQSALFASGFISLLLSWIFLAKKGRVFFRVLFLLLLGALLSWILIDEIGSALLSWIVNILQGAPELLGGGSGSGTIEIQRSWINLNLTARIFFEDLSDWWQGLLVGSAMYNQQVTVLLWNYVIWVLACWLGWAIRAALKPFTVIIPVMGVMTFVVAYIKANTWILGLVMVICFILVVFFQHYLREHEWQMRSISFSEEIRLDILWIMVLISFVLIVSTMIVPSFSVRKIVTAIRDLTSSGDSVSVAPALGLYEAESGNFGGSSQSSGVLPVSHLIGNPPELNEKVVMHVQPEENFLSEVTDHPYWRSHTYERYTGRGWLVGDVSLVQMDANEKLPLMDFSDADEYEILFSLYENPEKRLYYTGGMITTSREFGAIFRPVESGEIGSDFFAGLMEYRAYRTNVAWPTQPVSSLVSSSEDYPQWISERYLQLPDTLPSSIFELADQIVEDSTDPYSKAAAIERYLRNFPYTLEVDPPPSDQDVVEYFLFDVQEGYCDYYASSMVVLSRAAGLPARLVVGYASGSFDRDHGEYEVTLADAHSWVEVYFPGFGWVEFEPTGNRLLIDRKSDFVVEQEERADFSFPKRISFFIQKAGLVIAYLTAGIITIGVGIMVIDFVSFARKTTEQISVIYLNRLIWFARKSKIPVSPSLTPFEFAAYFKLGLSDLWRGVKFAAELNTRGGEMIDQIIHYYVLVVFSEIQLGAEDRKLILGTWRKLAIFLVTSLMKSWFRKQDFQEPVPV